LEELSIAVTNEHTTTNELKRINEQLTAANADLETLGRLREIDLLEKKK